MPAALPIIIAATLLPKGQTAHSAFKIPIENLNPDSTCHIGGRSGKAALMRQIALVVWDEAFMVHRYGFEAVARMFRDLRNNRESAFGGVTMLILGDLRQTLPVMPRGSRVQIVNSCLTKSKVWTAFTRIILQKNMRVLSVNVGNRDKLLDHCKFLLALGDGKVPTDETGAVQIPEDFLLPVNDPNESLKWTYGDRPAPLPVKTSCSAAEYDRLLSENCDYYQYKTVLCPKNVDVDNLNEQMMQSLPGEDHIYHSADALQVGGDGNGLHVTTEFLNTINLSGLPPHVLTIKVGAVMMLLRNLSPKEGLCNGTRILITTTTQRLLYGIILSGDYHGNTCVIPRITLIPSNNPYAFKFGRRQFPIRHAYAMTINKSQGQTLNRVALYLPEPCFAHGQLYVAFSRCGYPPDNTTKTGLEVVVNDTMLQGRNKNMGGIRNTSTEGTSTPNVVLSEIFI